MTGRGELLADAGEKAVEIGVREQVVDGVEVRRRQIDRRRQTKPADVLMEELHARSAAAAPRDRQHFARAVDAADGNAESVREEAGEESGPATKIGSRLEPESVPIRQPLERAPNGAERREAERAVVGVGQLRIRPHGSKHVHAMMSWRPARRAGAVPQQFADPEQVSAAP